MTDKDYSFEPVGTVEPNAPPLVEAVEAVPSEEAEAETPSDTAIMIGCGLVGWVVGGPFMAILTALGGKYAADRHQGPIGETSRSVGRIAQSAGKKAKEEDFLGKLKATIRGLFGKKEEHSTNQGSTCK